LKGLLSSFKEPSSQREREREREKEGGEKPWAACGKRKNQGQSDFLGQKFWQKSGIGQPRK